MQKSDQITSIVAVLDLLLDNFPTTSVSIIGVEDAEFLTMEQSSGVWLQVWRYDREPWYSLTFNNYELNTFERYDVYDSGRISYHGVDDEDGIVGRIEAIDLAARTDLLKRLAQSARIV